MQTSGVFRLFFVICLDTRGDYRSAEGVSTTQQGERANGRTGAGVAPDVCPRPVPRALSRKDVRMRVDAVRRPVSVSAEGYGGPPKLQKKAESSAKAEASTKAEAPRHACEKRP